MSEILINPIFEPIANSDYRFLLYYGGRGGGKSWGIADTLILTSFIGKYRFLCTRETVQSLDDSVYTLLVDRIKAIGAGGFFRIINSRIYNTETGSEFKFKGLNDLRDSFIQSVKSFEGTDICWIEEAQNVSKKSLDILIPTIRKPGSKIIASWNPDAEDDAIEELVKNPRPRTYIQKINYYDNPHCPQEVIEEAENCKKNKPKDYDNIWLGNPKNTADNTVTKYFADDNIKHINYLDDINLYITCDFNVDPMCWVLAHLTHKQNPDTSYILDKNRQKILDKVFFFDEIVIENTNTRDTAQEFLERYGSHRADLIICGDASGDYRRAENNQTNYRQIKNILSKHFEGKTNKINFKLRAGNPQIKNRVEAWNNKVLTNKGVREIIISPNCKRLLQNCKQLAYKPGTSIIDLPTSNQIKQNTELKFLGHPFDAASYLVEYFFPVKVEK